MRQKIIMCISILFLITLSGVAQDISFNFPAGIGDWEKSGEAFEYVGDDLFEYINGGAELYHEYGFETVSVQDYSFGEELISVEVYKMKESAFGIFSMLRSAEDQEVDAGDGATIAGYYLMMWRGKHLFAITSQSGESGNENILISFAQQLSENLESGDIPELVKHIPENPVDENSIIYCKGSIALVNISEKAAEFLTGWEEAVVFKSINAEEDLFVICKYKSASAATENLNKIQPRKSSINLKQAGPYLVASIEGSDIDFITKSLETATE